MVIDDLDIFWPSLRPGEANPVPVVYPDAVLPGAVALESFQMIARRNPQILERPSNLELPELSAGYALECSELSNAVPFGDALRLLILIAEYHNNLMRY